MLNIKIKIRNFLIILVYISGLSWIYKFYLSFFYGKLYRVLCFHYIGKSSSINFENKLIWLKKHYEIIFLDNLHKREKNKELRGNELSITFDDGFADFHDVVLPLLIKHKIPVTLFIPTKILELSKANSFKFALNNIGIKKTLLNKTQILEISKSKFVKLQSHSHTHCNFGTETTTFLKQELRISKKKIQEITGKSVNMFAYPFGDIFNISNNALLALKEANYKIALTIIPGFNHNRSKKLILHRDSIDPNMNNFLLRAWLSGAYDVLKKIINWGRINVNKIST